MSKKAQGAKAVIDGNHNYATLDQALGIVIVALTVNQGAAVNPEHHRMKARWIVASAIVGWTIYIEKKAILRRAGHTERRRGLRTMVRELCRVLDAMRHFRSNRRPPAEVSCRSLRISNAQKLVHRGR